jgi:hypothetical protein
MRRLTLLLGLLAIVLSVGGSAGAGYWEVTYDLTGSTSTTVTTALGATMVDPVTGSFTIEYDGPKAGPVTGARLAAGATQVIMSQTWVGVFTLTGTTDTVMSPPPPGAAGVINPPNLTLPSLATTSVSVSGFIHCYNGSLNCTSAGTAFVHSVPVAQVTLGPWPGQKFVFTGAVGNSDFTSTGAPQTVPQTPPVTVINTYVGKEISRVWNQDVPAVSNAGRVGLGLSLVLGGASLLMLRRGRRTRSAG